MFDRTLRIEKPPSVRERVGGHIDDTHQQGAIESKSLSFDLEIHGGAHVLLLQQHCIPVMTKIQFAYLPGHRCAALSICNHATPTGSLLLLTRHTIRRNSSTLESQRFAAS